MTEMTQHMADIIGAAMGDSGCKPVAKILKEDEYETWLAEWRHCVFAGYVYLDGTATMLGKLTRRKAIDSGMVRA